MKETGSSPGSADHGVQSSHQIPREVIRRRAEEIYVRSGRIAGRDLENWNQAEHELAQEAASDAAKKPEQEMNEDPENSDRRAVVVRVEGVKYVGEYREESAEGYEPGEFPPGSPISIRFSGDRMFVKRPNGKELETVIVEKTLAREKAAGS